MKCYVETLNLDHKCLIYRDQGFGTNPGKPLRPFSLEITNDELINLFTDAFAAFVTQCKKDDKDFGEIDIPELHQLNYPSLQDMVSNHQSVLAHILKEFLYFQLLDSITKNNPREYWRFAINEITDVRWDKQNFFIDGKGYSI